MMLSLLSEQKQLRHRFREPRSFLRFANLDPCPSTFPCGDSLPVRRSLMKALCGRMGGKIRSEYAMVGDVINLAARLMGKAKGRIVCDEVTHDLVRTE